MHERLGIAGSGAIACGLAATAAAHGDVILWARSDDGRKRAEGTVGKLCGRLENVDASRVKVVGDLEALGEASFVVEAIVEHHGSKADLLGRLAAGAAEDTVLASTTSSLSVQRLADATGRPDRFVALHVFNPVTKMDLVELSFPTQATDETRERARRVVAELGKTAVEVPDIPGFIVNRLLFPYLFTAVILQEETGLEAEAIDTAMKLGAGHPMGPLALLDLVGLDVAQAIGEAIGADIPPRVEELIDEGALGRKTGRGFYTYEKR